MSTREVSCERSVVIFGAEMDLLVEVGIRGTSSHLWSTLGHLSSVDFVRQHGGDRLRSEHDKPMDRRLGFVECLEVCPAVLSFAKGGEKGPDLEYSRNLDYSCLWYDTCC